MGLLSTEYNSLNELFLDELKDIYDAEKRILDALPEMMESANDAELRNAFNEHQLQTETHCTRLERVFASLGVEPDRKTCAAIKGILSEGGDMIKSKGDPSVHDAGLIAAAQRVEHYEMAVYGTLRTWAEQLGFPDCAETLQETLDEESAADKRLTEIAENRISVVRQQA